MASCINSQAARKTSTRRRSLQCIQATAVSPKVSSSTQPDRRRGGWMIVAIHDTQESWEWFRDGVLAPRMTEDIEGGFTTPPQETVFTVHNHVTS